jgi:putative membrane protein
MAVARRVKAGVRSRTVSVTVLLSAIGFALVLGTFGGLIDIYPNLEESGVQLLSHLIAVVNTIALAALLAGVYFIRNREIRKHRAAMLTAFCFISLFLVFYLLKVGGGFEKSIVAPAYVKLPYLVMLAVHILLSVVAMPVVIYAVVLGLTHTPAELKETPHARIGRIAAASWILSLALGVITYLLLNHAYSWERVESLLVFALAIPRSSLEWLD